MEFYLSSTVVEHLPHDPKIKGLNPAIDTGRGRKMGEKYRRLNFTLEAQW